MERTCFKCQHHAVCRIFDRLSVAVTAEGHGILDPGDLNFIQSVNTEGVIKDIFVSLSKCCMWFDGVNTDEGKDNQPEASKGTSP